MYQEWTEETCPAHSPAYASGKNWVLGHNREELRLFFAPTSYTPSGIVLLLPTPGCKLLAWANLQQVGTGSHRQEIKEKETQGLSVTWEWESCILPEKLKACVLRL